MKQPKEPIYLPDGAWEEVDAVEAPPARARAVLRLRRAGRRLRRMLPGVVPAVLYLLLCSALFLNAVQGDAGEGSLSLRYTPPLTKEAVADAQYTLHDPDLKTDFAALWWQELPGEEVSTTRGAVNTPVFVADGDIAAALRLEYVQGCAPAAMDSAGVALSEQLAWELFGGDDIIGAELKWKDKPYIVRGVYKGGANHMVAQVDARYAPVDGFSGVELTGTPEGDPREAAEAFAQQAGIGTPQAVVNTHTLPDLAWFLAWLPLLVLVLWFFGKCFGAVRALPYWPRQGVWLALMLAAALLLPRAMGLLPGWAIPSQWSNLDHWSALAKDLGARFTQLLSLAPHRGEVETRKHLLLQILLVVPTLFSLTATIRWWSRFWPGRRRRPSAAPRVHIPLAEALPAHSAHRLPPAAEATLHVGGLHAPQSAGGPAPLPLQDPLQEPE